MPENVPEAVARVADSNARELRRLEDRNVAQVRQRLDQVVLKLQRDIESLPPGTYQRGRAAVVQLMAKAAASGATDSLKELISEANALGRTMAQEHLEPEINAWLEHYGEAVRPLNIAAAAAVERGPLLAQYPASVQAYGQAVIAQIQGTLSSAILSQDNPKLTTNAVQRAIQAEAWRAERIVRTETHNAYNAAHLEGLREARDSGQIPNLRKSAIVTFDARTNADSLPMQGQIRELEDYFLDGKGRRFLHPPGRPNDREKEIPWIDDEDLVLPSVEEAQELATQRRQVEIEAAAAARLETFEGRRERLSLGWTNGSHSRTAAEIKEALKLIGIPGQPYQRRQYDLDPARVDQSGEDLRRIYADTQKYYADRGITSVRLYRGVKGDYDIAGSIEAWTSDEKTARKFGTHGILYDDIPVKDLLWSHEAPGWKNGKYGQQYEYLVIGGPPKARWLKEDFEIGFFRASEFDEEPELDERGYWGLASGGGGESTLWHLPTQRELVTGAYSKAQLKLVADELERSGYLEQGSGALIADEHLRALREIAKTSAEDRAIKELYARVDRQLDWRRDDFEIGFFSAREIDEDAEAAGIWGVLEYRPTEADPAGGATLYNRRSGQQVLSGVYTKADLKAVAARLDTLLDEQGRLPGEDDPRTADLEEEIRFTREYLERRRITGYPGLTGDKAPARWVDLGGAEWPAINDDVKPNAAGRWGRNRIFQVAERQLDGSIKITEQKGHTAGNFGIYSTDSTFTNANQYKVSDFHLVHLPTGLEIHQGVSMDISTGTQTGYEVGGWRAGIFKTVAEDLERFLEPDGNVKPELKEEWLAEIESLQRQSAPGKDVRSWLGSKFVREDWIQSPISIELPARYDEDKNEINPAEAIDWLVNGPLFDEVPDRVDAKTNKPVPFDDEVPF